MQAINLHLFATLFAILNPIGNTALFIGLTSHQDPKTQHKEIVKCTIAIAVILLFSVWLGNSMLDFFEININAFIVAGGLVVFLIGLSMIQAQPLTHKYQQKQLQKSAANQSAAIVPLAIPIIAGPGAIAAVISKVSLHPNIMHRLGDSITCIIMAVIVGIILSAAPFIAQKLGEEGLKIVTRIMGLIITSIAIQMIVIGTKTLILT